MAGLEGVHCNQDTLTGPKGGWIRGSSLYFDWSLDYPIKVAGLEEVTLVRTLCLVPKVA